MPTLNDPVASFILKLAHGGLGLTLYFGRIRCPVAVVFRAWDG